MATRTENLSKQFVGRRIHSLLGLWLVVYLFEHLIVNSQAALWIGDDGSAFIQLVNSLESLPFLQVIEWLLIGIPLLVHAGLGIWRLWQPKLNSFGGHGKEPLLTYGRNRAFTWQRLTSWILLFAIVGHVIQMRFLGYPTHVEVNNEVHYLTRISFDEGLYTLSKRLHVTLYSAEEIDTLRQQIRAQPPVHIDVDSNPSIYSEDMAQQYDTWQKRGQAKEWIHTLASFHLKDNEVIAEANKPGTAMLLMVRDHFKSPLMAVLYTIFVLAAVFHACNGFWTALITWGAMLSYRSQKAMIPIAWIWVGVLSFLGLASIWGSYWLNLRN